MCDLTSTLRQAENCMLFNANNLRKNSFGNVEYGGVTYVLNKQALKGRLFWEAFDAGVTEFLHYLCGLYGEHVVIHARA